ncbi:MAG: Bug family tripartite tricarboxylate transporter substrate binding protein [Pseudolabrys sp.]
MMKFLLAGLCGIAMQASPASAEVYPSRPITIVVPFGAGGPADTLARLLGERMRNSLGQSVIVENAPGAAGSIGVGRVVRATPDGYTIGIGHLGTHVFNGALYKLQYDLVNDLEPIALLPSNVYVVAVKKDLPVKNLKDLIAWLKANPEQATVATAGVGSIAHLAAVYFQSMTGVPLKVVPYRGGAQALNDVLGGHITMLFDQLSGGSVAMYQSGKIHPLAVMAKKRLALAPEIPTVDEAGLPGLYVSTWYGLWAPKGTPKDIIGKLNAAVVEALADPDLRKKLEAQAAQIPPRDQQTPEALGALQKAEIAKWWPIIKAANIKVE